MLAEVNTKSNFRGLNGQQLQVVEILGTRVTCLVPDEIHGFIRADFSLREIVSFPVGMQQLHGNKIYDYQYR